MSSTSTLFVSNIYFAGDGTSSNMLDQIFSEKKAVPCI